ncbi:MAG: hypothetical protein AAGF30_06860 [Pseudomonadota bacterium]
MIATFLPAFISSDLDPDGAEMMLRDDDAATGGHSGGGGWLPGNPACPI